MVDTAKPAAAGGGQSAGPATDSSNTPVVDPTRNVLDLVEAATKRLDDLRENDKAWRDKFDDAQQKYTEAIAVKETDRIDAIRAVDVAAVQQAALAAETRATALAAQVSSTAEANRAQVAAAASAAATSLAAALEPVQKDIADLRRAQYEAQGQKTQVVETRAQIGSTQAVIGIALALLGAASLYLGTRSPDPVIVQPTTVTVPATP